MANKIKKYTLSLNWDYLTPIFQFTIKEEGYKMLKNCINKKEVLRRLYIL